MISHVISHDMSVESAELSAEAAQRGAALGRHALTSHAIHRVLTLVISHRTSQEPAGTKALTHVISHTTSQEPAA